MTCFNRQFPPTTQFNRSKCLKIKPTLTLNAKVCETYPQVVQACVDAGWELNAHSYDQMPMHKLDDQKAVIEKSVAITDP